MSRKIGRVVSRKRLRFRLLFGNNRRRDYHTEACRRVVRSENSSKRPGNRCRLGGPRLHPLVAGALSRPPGVITSTLRPYRDRFVYRFPGTPASGPVLSASPAPAMLDENQMLRENLEAQLERVVQQLSDLDQCRTDMTDDEYNESKEDTVEQLKEFNERLSKITAGNTTLHDELSTVRLATSAAITEAFQTPSIIKMFAKNEPNALKDKRDQIDRNMKLGKLNPEIGNRQKLEVLTALRHLGCELSDSDKMFVREETSKLHGSTSSSGFNIPDSLNGFDFNTFLKIDDDAP